MNRTVMMKSSDFTDILGSREPVWEFAATDKEIFKDIKGPVEGFTYKLTLRQTTGVNRPDKIFKDLIDECPVALGALYTYVGPQVKSAYVDPVKVSYIWDDVADTLHSYVKFLDPNLSIECLLVGIIATWIDQRKQRSKKRSKKK